MKTQLFVRDAQFYKKLLAIAVPIALQNLINVGVSMADTLMLGRLGEVALSSASIANQLFFMLTIFGFGLTGGANVLIAQYWGKDNVSMIRKIMSLVLKISLVVSILFGALALFVPEFIISIFTADAEVIAGGASYLRVIGWAYPLYMVSNCMIMMFRPAGKVRISVVTYLISLFINIFFNWVFIFGNLGAPAWGVAGAALATAIARVSEFVIIFVYTFKIEKAVAFRPKDLLLGTEREVVQNFVSNAAPIVFNELLWSSGASAVAIVIGRMGKEFVAANSINQVVMQFSTVAIMGLGNAAATVIGNTIGEGRIEDAKERAKTLVVLSLIVGVVAGSIVALVRGPVIGFYNIGDLTQEYAFGIMGVTVFLVFFQSISMITMIGVLRGGGDGRFVLVLDVIFMWTIAIPLGAVAGLVLHWPVPVVFFILKCDEVIKIFFSVGRILRGKWVRDVTI